MKKKQLLMTALALAFSVGVNAQVEAAQHQEVLWMLMKTHHR